MSKIYKRPMFRGGGKVSSYGNGITSPLVPGYQGGGQIGGGIIYGKPMSDGRYGFQQPKLYSAADQVAQAELANVSPGLTYLENLKNMREGNVPMIPVNTPRKEPIKKEENDIVDITKEIDISGGYMEEETPDGTLMTEYENWEDVPKSIKNIPFSKDIFENQKKKKENLVMGRDLDYQDNLMQENYDTAQPIDTNNPGNILPPENAESTEISAKDAIAENQELFKELLGSKKARGQDISDMLLRFSGSEGNTLGEKFRNYTKAESAAGPGRNEKISQTAAGLAINDYVAGKRSEEQIDKLMKVEDYRMKLKESAVNINEGDNFRSALNKVSRAYKLDPNSNKSIAITLRELYNKPSFSINKEPKKLSKTKPPYKDLQIGFNIVTDKNGVKSILEKMSANDTQPKVRDDIVI